MEYLIKALIDVAIIAFTCYVSSYFLDKFNEPQSNRIDTVFLVQTTIIFVVGLMLVRNIFQIMVLVFKSAI